MAIVAAPDLLVEQTQESIVAIFPNLSRRQLLSTAAASSFAGIAPNVAFDAHAKSEIAQQAQALAPPSMEAQAQKFSAITLRRLREIAERNRVRQEAGLPLLSVPKELRRVKEAADAEKFRNFAEAHRRRVYEKMLARVRRQCCDPQWAPTGVLSGGGLWFDAQVDEQLTKLYRRLAVKWQAPDFRSL
jgi:rubrerythrin